VVMVRMIRFTHWEVSPAVEDVHRVMW
jgi:hypothetical protein